VATSVALDCSDTRKPIWPVNGNPIRKSSKRPRRAATEWPVQAQRRGAMTRHCTTASEVIE
jgi:hypothetical protein